MSINENTRPGDVLKVEAADRFSRKEVTITHAQTIVCGQILENNGSDEYQALSAGVDDVQTLTLTDGTDGGTFCVRYKNLVTAPLAWNITAADLQVALRALHADLAACTVGLVGAVYTVTNAKAPADLLEIVNDLTTDGGVFEGGVVVARTATGKIVGAGAECVALEAVTTEADPDLKQCAVVFRDAVLDKNFLTYGANVTTAGQKTAIDAVLADLRMDVKTSV